MKKTLSIFCAVALLLCSVMMPVSAANTNMKVTAALNGTTQPTVGADFTVNIVLSGNTDSTDADVYEWEGLCYGKLTVTFSDGLTLKSSALGDCMKSMATFKTAGMSPEKNVYSDTLGHSGNGTLFTLTLNAARQLIISIVAPKNVKSILHHQFCLQFIGKYDKLRLLYSHVFDSLPA